MISPTNSSLKISELEWLRFVTRQPASPDCQKMTRAFFQLLVSRKLGMPWQAVQVDLPSIELMTRLHEVAEKLLNSASLVEEVAHKVSSPPNSPPRAPSPSDIV